MRRGKYKYLLLGFLLLGIFGICGCGKKEDSYRMIKVMTLEGTAKVTRENVGELDAYVDMRLESGDKLAVASDSSMVLDLDDDKYVLLEPGTKMSLIAEGTSTDSRTVIQLTEGAVVNQLTNKLTEDSSYEVTVPNSTMAVRGTVFRVEIRYDADGDSYAVLSVLEGTVGCVLIFPDGRIQTLDEEREVPSGMQVQVHGDTEISEYYPYDLQEIDFSRYTLEALEFLNFCIDNNADLCITKSEIEKWKQLLLNKGNSENTEEEVEESDEEDTEDTKTGEELKNKVTPAAVVQPQEDEEQSRSGGTSSDTGSSSSSKGSSKKPSSGSSSANTTYTVTFTYNGSVFCTQTVNSGGTAVAPTLMPTTAGSWDFDFTTVITSDMTIEWNKT